MQEQKHEEKHEEEHEEKHEEEHEEKQEEEQEKIYLTVTEVATLFDMSRDWVIKRCHDKTFPSFQAKKCGSIKIYKKAIDDIIEKQKSGGDK
jgi:predicted DNA-binding transcriptional regulator AlpA